MGTLGRSKRSKRCQGHFPILRLASSRHIELNPVRAWIVAEPGDYAWSSFRTNAGGPPDALQTPPALKGAWDDGPRGRPFLGPLAFTPSKQGTPLTEANPIARIDFMLAPG
jgi:hypothetical protein